MPIIAYGKIKPLRQAKGLNQSEIAAELGVSRPTFVLMEQGEREPTLSQLHTLARLLGVEVDELCTNLPSVALEMTNFPKLKELALVCAASGANDGAITKTKLAILLYLVDFAWYYYQSRPMTGATYRLGARGPVADDYFRALDELHEGQAIALEPSGVAMIIKFIEQPTAKLLNQEELALARKICDKWRQESTEAITNFVRLQVPCKNTKLGDPIPYEAILAVPETSLF